MSTSARSTAAGGQALEIARRLLDPADVLAVAPADASLGSGLAGTALLHARLSAADPIFAAAAAQHLTAAANCTQRRLGGIYTGRARADRSPLHPHHDDQQSGQRHKTRRDAWCYGTPGIAAALTLAGRAIADRDLTNVGEDAMTVLGHRPADTWDVTGPALCHGYAGVLQAACRTRSHTTADKSVAAIAASFDPSLPFAVASQGQDGHHENRPGFLTGAAGTALALAEYAQLPTAPVVTTWDAVLLLT